MPAKASDSAYEYNQLAWSFEIPADGETTVWAEIACSSGSTYFPSTWTQSNYISTTTAGARTSGYAAAPEFTPSTYGSATFGKAGAYVSSTATNYWAVVPVLTLDSAVDDGTQASSALDCSATFKETDALGYPKTLLVLAEQNNGPYYMKASTTIDSTHNGYRWNYYNADGYDDKMYLNYNYDKTDFQWSNGQTGSFSVKMLTQYGLEKDSWCLAMLPDRVDGNTVTTENSLGNLTTLDEFSYNGQVMLLLTDS